MLILAGGTSPHWSEIWQARQALFLPHSSRILTFKCNTYAPGRCRPGGTSPWALLGSRQLERFIFAGKLSPDGQYLAALKAIFDAVGNPLRQVCTLVHVDLARGRVHHVVERFEQHHANMCWVPGQRLAEHRAYLLADSWQRVFICDCHHHRVLRIVEARAWPLSPSEIFRCNNIWAMFMDDGRSAVIKAQDSLEIHVVSWRSLQ